MKIYSLADHASVNHDVHGSYTTDEDGAVEVPDEFGVQLLNTHVDGKAQWEDEPARHARLLREEDERRRDPKALLEAVEKLTSKVVEVSDPQAAERARAEADAKAAAAAAEEDRKKAEAKAKFEEEQAAKTTKKPTGGKSR